MEKKNLRKYGIHTLKVVGTALALYFVLRKIDLAALKSTLLSIHLGWFVIAIVLYNASKIVSALRLNIFFRAIAIHLTELFNLRLYYFGMFLNLFLPGGIGGDGYKAYYLKKKYEVKTKKLLAAILKDRISGLAALVFLTLLIFVFIGGQFDLPDQWIIWLVYSALLLCFPAYYIFTRLYFKSFKADFFKTTGYAFMVQSIQVLCAYVILLSLGVKQGEWIYLDLFLVSSIVTIIPITVGGLGMRETVFLLASSMAGIDENKAVSLGFIFFIITAISSLVGVFVRLESSKTPDINHMPPESHTSTSQTTP